MAVNRNKEHLIIFGEDAPYRDIVNGIQLSANVNAHYIDNRKPCGGWLKVFETFDKHSKILGQYKTSYILLLIDFDDKNSNSERNFRKRVAKFKELVSEDYHNRVFLLGTNHKESEALKKEFFISNFEDIGKLLVEDCPDSDLSHWQNIHLKCNLPEIERMKENGIFEWLFK